MKKEAMSWQSFVFHFQSNRRGQKGHFSKGSKDCSPQKATASTSTPFNLQHPCKTCIILCSKVKTEGEEDMKRPD